MSASKDMQPERMRLASELWSQGIAAEFTYKANPFMPEQMSYATNAGIPIGVVLRPDELKQVRFNHPLFPSSQPTGSQLAFRILVGCSETWSASKQRFNLICIATC